MYVVVAIGFQRVLRARGSTVDLITEAVALHTKEDFSVQDVLSYKLRTDINDELVLNDEQTFRFKGEIEHFFLRILEWVSDGATLICWSHKQSVEIIKHNMRTFGITFNQEWFNKVVDLRLIFADKQNLVEVNEVTLGSALVASRMDFNPYRGRSKLELCHKLRLLAQENIPLYTVQVHESEKEEFLWREPPQVCPKCFNLVALKPQSVDKNYRNSHAECVNCGGIYQFREVVRKVNNNRIVYQIYVKELQSIKNGSTKPVVVDTTHMN